MVGATVSLLDTGFSTASDPTGNFTLSGVPAGSQILDIDTDTANPAPDGSAYASFREEIELIENVNNVVSRPFFLPRIAQESLTTVDPNATTMVTNPTLDVTVTVPPNTAKNQDGTNFTGALSISEVPAALAPAALPDTLQPGLLITIQPVGVTFATPVPITFPNIDNLAPGSEVNIWSLDPTTGTFAVVGIGRVSADGTVIETISGGIRAADWHFFLPPSLEGLLSLVNNFNQDQSKCCKVSGGSQTAVSSGDLTVDHPLVSYRSLGQSRAPRLVYHSLSADPQPVIATNATIPVRTAVPLTVSARLSVAGLKQGAEAFTDTSGLGEGTDEIIRQVVQFDASAFPSGLYPYQLTLTSKYAISSGSTVQMGNVLVQNQQQSPFGAGWTLQGVQRLQGVVRPLLTDGDGSALVFIPNVSFAAAPDVAVPSQPHWLATGDFNGDSTLDLVTAHRSSTVSIRLGDGTGGFAAAADVPVTSGTQSSVAVGDFKRDGKLDFASANDSIANNFVAIRLGDGAGNFSAAANVAVARSATSLAVGDFNRDGALDFATGHINGTTVSIRLGNGAGGFAAAPDLTGFSFPRTVAAGDFNRDGILDLAVADTTSNEVAIRLGDGTGGFSAAPDVRVVQSPDRLAVGDFNRDTILDFAVVVTVLGSQRIAIRLGDGTGGFLAAPDVVPGMRPFAGFRSVAVGDFNGDGISDLAAANSHISSSSTVEIHLGQGDGSFLASTDVAVGTLTQSVVVGDFNRDGTLDFATADNTSRELSIRLGVLDNAFQSPPGEFSRLVKNADGTFTRTLKNGTQIHFSAEGLQTSVVDRNGNTTLYAYDTDGRVTAITDPTGLVTTWTYTGGLLSSTTDPAGRITRFEYDAAGNLIRITDPDLSTRHFAYDARHRMLSQTSPNGFVTTYDYNFAGRNIQVNRPDGSTRKTSPSELVGLADLTSGLGTKSNPIPVVRPDAVIAAFTDGNGNVTQYTTDLFGASTATTDALDRETTIERDANSNPTQITRPNDAVTTITYDDRGNLLTSTEESIQATTTFTYEPTFNQVTSITDPKNNPPTMINYDAMGNPIEIVDAKGTRSLLRYDDPNCPGQLMSVTAAAGLSEENTTSFTYDPATCNLVHTTDPLGHTTDLEYNAAGDVIQSTDAEGRVTRFRYDALNRLTKGIDATNVEVDPPCGTAGVTCYGYDRQGNLTTVTDARGSMTQFEYDALNRVKTSIDPLGRPETFAYDDNGNLRSTLDRKGQTIEFQYDEVDQLEHKTWTPGTPEAAVTDYTYDTVGDLTSVIDPDSALTMTYDKLSRLSCVSTAGSPTQQSIQIDYTYDKNGNRETMTTRTDQACDAGGQNIAVAAATGQTVYLYDELNRLTSLTNPSAQTMEFHYDALSRRSQTVLPNATTASFIYDLASQLLSLANGLGATPLSSFAYTYDKVGNRKTLAQDRSGVSLAILVEPSLSYGYDSLNRLIEATHPLPGSPLETFGYDSVGNRLRRDGQTTDAVFDAANQLGEDQDFTYDYDLNGNITKKINKLGGGTTSYTYDAENQLTRIDFADGTFTEYRYDGLGRRIEKNVNVQITRYVYDSEDILFEFDGANTLLARYTHGYGIDEPLVMQRDLDTSGNFEDAEKFFYHVDGLGSITDLTDSTGTVARAYVYDSYGRIVHQVGSLVNPYTYTGREFDTESGLYYYRTRFYDPTMGRFLSRDPIGLAGGINQYRYVSNNPINFVDPLGLWGIQFGNFNLGIGDPNLKFDASSIYALEQGAFATIDGFIPLGDPFKGAYDPAFSDTVISCEDANRSAALGGIARTALTVAAGSAFFKALGTALAPAATATQARILGRFAVPVVIANSVAEVAGPLAGNAVGGVILSAGAAVVGNTVVTTYQNAVTAVTGK